MKSLSSASVDDKPRLGKLINECKVRIEGMFAAKLAEIEDAELDCRPDDAIDPTIPVLRSGGIHPLSAIEEEMVEIFRRVGFTVADGPEIETVWYCYDALNVPESHPARDSMDTFYFPSGTRVGNVSRHGDEPYILRSQTSTVQIRTMESERPPLRIVSPGRTFRRDNIDATHSSNFHQMEGMVIDRDVSVVDLRAILDFLIRAMFGSRCEIRLRPSFFPFTEPSFEVDFRSPNMGKLSGRWIEVIGCGMVHQNVFSAVGYDSGEWSGYAFAVGIERIAMLAYGIDDIRLFYQNDVRFLRQFAGNYPR
jgi:phenylalanyl-tRNA synthetase alpha chain